MSVQKQTFNYINTQTHDNKKAEIVPVP